MHLNVSGGISNENLMNHKVENMLLVLLINWCINSFLFLALAYEI